MKQAMVTFLVMALIDMNDDDDYRELDRIESRERLLCCVIEGEVP
jgi:hypothetical protein